MFDKKKETFRKAALERLASPERLDEMMQITAPKGWIALGTCILLILLGLVWSIFGRIPERVMAQGMLIPGGSLLQVEGSTQGMITQVLVKVGDTVQAGDRVAGINLSGKEFDLSMLEEELADSLKRDQMLSTSEKLRYEADKAKIREKRLSLESERGTKQAALEGAQTEYNRAQRLFSQGAAPKSRVEQASLKLSEASTALGSIESSSAELDAENERLNTEILQAKSARETEIADLKRKITKKTQETESNAFVKTPYTGRVTEIAVTAGTTITEQQVLMRLERIDEELKALLYVPSKPGKKIELGHLVHISPSTVRKEEFGSVLAEVSDKMTQPATPAGMLKDLGNERLVEEYSSSGAPLRLEATMKKNEISESGYEWTSGEGPPIKIFSGTPCQASVIVGRKRPIDYVIPIIKDLVGGA